MDTDLILPLGGYSIEAPSEGFHISEKLTSRWFGKLCVAPQSLKSKAMEPLHNSALFYFTLIFLIIKD